jgi:hypothetical protein
MPINAREDCGRTTRWTKVLNSVDFQWLANPFGLGHRQRYVSEFRM